MKFKYLLKESLAAGGLIGMAAFCYTACLLWYGCRADILESGYCILD